ncbi:MAG: 16S rRNA (uracil(1498)-N(3))-methyltransferase [Gammaproteobacteria bacterium]
MRLSRVFASLPLAEHTEYVLTGATAHYLSTVLRLQRGMSLWVFNGEGGQFEAQVQWVRKGAVQIRTGNHQTMERESPLRIILGHSLCRAERSDYVIQKAAELGVIRIDPLLTERTVVRLDSYRAERRVAHWQSVAVEACEQCGRDRLLAVSPIKQMTDWLAESPVDGLGLVLDPTAQCGLDSVAPPTAGVTLLMGPEGGLTSRELELAQAAGFSAVHLGPRTLRADTAAIAAVVALQLRFGDLT